MENPDRKISGPAVSYGQRSRRRWRSAVVSTTCSVMMGIVDIGPSLVKVQLFRWMMEAPKLGDREWPQISKILRTASQASAVPVAVESSCTYIPITKLWPSWRSIGVLNPPQNTQGENLVGGRVEAAIITPHCYNLLACTDGWQLGNSSSKTTSASSVTIHRSRAVETWHRLW